VTTRHVGQVGAAVLCLLLGACASQPVAVATGPRFPDYPQPDVPASLRVAADLRDRQNEGWRRLQAGDLAGASRTFDDLVKRSPGFYPAETGLGYVALANRQYKQASGHFATALTASGRYAPALDGQADAKLGLHDDEGALTALEQLLKLDPSRDSVRSRLDVVKLRVVEAQVEAGTRARQAGRLDEAQTVFEHALEVSPSNAVILRELAIVETARGSLDAAEVHARRSVQLDDGDAEAQAALASVCEAKGQYKEAADALARAVAIDPRPAWRNRVEPLRAKAAAAAIPTEYRAISSAASVTRADVAAMIGMRLAGLLDRAAKRPTVVVTDVRGHWAAPWILPVTQAGVMEIFPNHTFQPATVVRRSDLAVVVSALVTLAGARHPDDTARWQAARPHFADLAATHLHYPAAAMAVSSGAMTAADGDRFWPSRPVSGQELIAAIARIEQIAGR
jgi:tetratricopeptide (TPR) repeat protein